MVEIKGSVILDTLKTVKLKWGGEVFRKILDSLDKETRQIFEAKTILVTDWYPLVAFIKFVDATIQMTASGNKNEMIQLTDEILLKQLQGIYKVFVKADSPESIIKRVVVIHNTYFRGVEVEVGMVGNRKARVKHIGFRKEHQLISYGIISFYKKALELSGAKNIDMKYITPIEADKGYSELEITWTE